MTIEAKKYKKLYEESQVCNVNLIKEAVEMREAVMVFQMQTISDKQTIAFRDAEIARILFELEDEVLDRIMNNAKQTEGE